MHQRLPRHSRKKVRLLKKWKQRNLPTQNKTVLVLACLGIAVTVTAMVLVVRAYLVSQTGSKTNRFAPMTYTNTDIYEPTSSFEYHDPTEEINKKIQVKNNEGSDKKPVYIRVALQATVYDASGLNVTAEHPVTVTYPQTESNWSKQGDYYYYKHVVDPGHFTTVLFGTNKITVAETTGKELPNGCYVDIAVVADTVQAVETDSMLWAEENPKYTLAYVKRTWGESTVTAAGLDTTDVHAAQATA